MGTCGERDCVVHCMRRTHSDVGALSHRRPTQFSATPSPYILETRPDGFTTPTHPIPPPLHATWSWSNCGPRGWKTISMASLRQRGSRLRLAPRRPGLARRDSSSLKLASHCAPKLPQTWPIISQRRYGTEYSPSCLLNLSAACCASTSCFAAILAPAPAARSTWLPHTLHAPLHCPQ